MTKEEFIKKKFCVVSLGCDKNRVDSERLTYLLSNYGLTYTNNLDEANIILLNTCSFIQSAKEESIEHILELAKYKTTNCEKLVVCGCLAQRYYEEVKQGFPEIDAVVRLKNNVLIVEILKGLYGVEATKKEKIKHKQPMRVISTAKHYAFLKIADGCNNCCAYCTIPQIRGRYTSVPPKELINEAKALVKSGVQELILVAQDVTKYGVDLFNQPMLVTLIKELSKIKKLKWIRLHYCYPHQITDELLNEIASNPKVVKYLDIPMQHASDNVLKAMNRRDTMAEYETLLSKIRKLPCFVAIRSTFIVGFPGETKQDFNILKEFLVRNKLNYVGFFKYSREEFTMAGRMENQIAEKVKDSRLNEIECLQQKIMFEAQQKFLNKTVLSVLEKVEEDGSYVLRNQYNSPNVDTLIYVRTDEKLEIGNFYKVKIIGFEGIDLLGEIV